VIIGQITRKKALIPGGPISLGWRLWNNACGGWHREPGRGVSGGAFVSADSLCLPFDQSYARLYLLALPCGIGSRHLMKVL
jgi:hypothetical protein